MCFLRLASATVAAALALALPLVLPLQATAHARVHPGRTTAGDTDPGSWDLFGAACWIRVDGSRVTAYCRNPYPDIDRVSLHVECVHWWDLDFDSRPVAAEPAQTVQLTGRCWTKVRSAWISHRRAS